MKVSQREEALAKELYETDMNSHQAEDVPWEQALEVVANSYRRQAMRIVNTKWFRQQLEAVNRDKENSYNRVS